MEAPRLLVLRNYIVYRSAWKLFLTGFLEPVFYLFSIGDRRRAARSTTFEFNGEQIPYAAFVAPGMLAASAFNGALLDSTYNVFFKLKYDKLYDQMLATPLTTGDIARGEIVWGQLRGGSYSAAFLVVMLAMGLVDSWWAVLALPAALLIGFAFSALFMAVTTYFTSWQDFDKITLVQLPLFLFSATFFPITRVRRGAALGRRGHAALPRVWCCAGSSRRASITSASAVSVVYLVVMGLLGLMVVRRRLDALLLTYALAPPKTSAYAASRASASRSGHDRVRAVAGPDEASGLARQVDVPRAGGRRAGRRRREVADRGEVPEPRRRRAREHTDRADHRRAHARGRPDAAPPRGGRP